MSSLDRWYIDLSLVTFLTGVAVLTVVFDVPGVVRAAAVVPLVTILPGYAFISSLFPTAGNHAVRSFDENERGLRNPLSTKHGVDTIERIVFAVSTTLVIVPSVALVANFTPAGITLYPLLIGVAGFTMLFTIGGLIRRARLPSERRYVPPIAAVWRNVSYSNIGTGFAADDDRWRLFNVALVVGTLVFLSTIGYAAVSPPQDEGFTEFYVNTGNVSGDTRAMYPTQFDTGESRPLSVTVTNQEHETVEYEIVVGIQRVDRTDDGIQVLDRNRLTSRTATLDHQETRTVSFDVSPDMRGSDLRLMVYLYRGQAPADPTGDSAYRTLRLSVDVEGAA